LSASCLVSELTVSELVCQRDVGLPLICTAILLMMGKISTCCFLPTLPGFQLRQQQLICNSCKWLHNYNN